MYIEAADIPAAATDGRKQAPFRAWLGAYANGPLPTSEAAIFFGALKGVQQRGRVMRGEAFGAGLFVVRPRDCDLSRGRFQKDCLIIKLLQQQRHTGMDCRYPQMTWR